MSSQQQEEQEQDGSQQQEQHQHQQEQEEQGEQGCAVAEEGSSEDESCSQAADSDSSNSSSSSSSKKKKRKKAKKKKKGGGGGEEGAQPQPQPPQASKQDRSAAEKRYVAALATIAAKDNDDLWINLNGALLQDAKVEQLLAKLKSNSTITSLNLSNNSISDAGAQAISTVLEEHGAAPELIQLDLRDNTSISPAGRARLEQLSKLRSQLDVKLGSVLDELTPPEGKELKDLSKGPMFKKFFQGQGEAEEASTSQQDQPDIPKTSPPELWSRVTLLLKEGRAGIVELALVLQELAAILQYEFSMAPPPPPPNAPREHQDELLQPGSHVHACLDHLPALQASMDLEPPDVGVQSSKLPQPAVGSHRVWASAVIALLLTRGSHVIDQSLARTQLVPTLLRLALQRPLCNALHTKALHVLHACANSCEDDLLASMITSVDQGAGSKPSLLDVLVDLCSASVDVTCGLRSPLVGFAISAGRILQGMCNDPPGSPIRSEAVRQALGAHNRWCAFVQEGGTLERLCSVQDQELGGPRPNPMAGYAADAEGGMMSSESILQLISSMQL